MRPSSVAAVTLLSTLLLTACSPDDKAPHPPVARSGLVLFVNTTYVDYSDLASPGYSHEARNVYEDLILTGLPVTTFTGITSTEIDATLAGKAVFLVPELTGISLAAALDAAARASIETFVYGGGTLVLFLPTSSSTALLNGVFGFSTGWTSFVGPATLNSAAAVGTSFEGGAASLPYNNLTTSLTHASLPAGAIEMYGDAIGNSAVTVIPYGAGNIVFLGWDWYNAAPLGTLDGGWLDVLVSAVTL